MIRLQLRGIGFWAPGVEDWTAAQDVLRNGQPWPRPERTGRPATTLMPANERRRAPDSVLLALAVADQAVRAAGLDPATVPSVFASRYGDLAISDYMCATLRDDPATMSPTRFHNSVHNAPSGYWSIATGARVAASSIAASTHSFAAGLFEAAVQARELNAPVLLAAYDIAATGPMRQVTASEQPFGCALVLDPSTQPSPAPLLSMEFQPGQTATGSIEGEADRGPVGNPIASAAMPLLRWLAGDEAGSTLHLPLSSGLMLALTLSR